MLQWILHAQTTIVSGYVFDAKTFEPVAFANVFFNNTNIGTTTNFEGFFELKTDENVDSITVSFIGYNIASIQLKTNIGQTINFHLQPTVFGLSEVLIHAGENPANIVMRKAIFNKSRYNVDNLDVLEYNSYAKTQVFLRRFFERNHEKDKRNEGMIDKYFVVAEKNTKPALPIYMNESYSKIFYRRFPKREKVIIKAANTISLDDTETIILTQLLQKNVNYNFNQNYVRILDKNFVSPISDIGFLYYNYYLMDSLYIDDKYCFEIRVVPRRKEDLAFQGTIWINDSTYALKRISVEVGKQANVNYVERIRIQQELILTSLGVYVVHKARITSDAVNIFLNAYIVNENYEFKKEYPLNFYDTEIIITDTAFQVNDRIWKMLRPFELDSIDLVIKDNIFDLKNKTCVKLLTALANMSIKGFFSIGKIELGPYILFYSNNKVEGHRFRIGYKTNCQFSKKWISQSYLAYGTNDDKFKYNFQLERFLSRKYWTKFGIQYSEDVERLGSIDIFYSNNTLTSFASSFGGTDKMNKIIVGRMWFETDIFRGFNQKIVFKNKYYSPLSTDYYFSYFTNSKRTETTSDITVSEISFTSIYQPKATFLIDKNDRYPVALMKFPAFTFNYSIGIKYLLNSDFDYHTVSLGVKQSIMLGTIGVMSYDIKLSKCFTSLPYPLLTIFAANESFFRTEKTYNLMRYGEFVADEAIEMFLTFRQDGFILDRLPIIKKLGLRSVATANIAFGSFDSEINGIYDAQKNPKGILSARDENGNEITSLRSLNFNKPYTEISYGIENILSFFRVEAIHRLTYNDKYETQDESSKFGIKFGAVFRF